MDNIFLDTEWSGDPNKGWGKTEEERGETPVANFEPILEAPLGAEVIEFPINGLDFPDPKNKYKSEVVKHNAKRFVEAIEGGASVGQAAAKIGLTAREIKSSDEMEAAIKKLISIGHIKDEVSKALLKAGLIKTFVEGITSSDKEAKKLALESAKILGPSVGMNTESEVHVTINLGELGDKIRGVTIPGIENPYVRGEEVEGGE